MDIRKLFGANMRRHRKAAGYSQEAVAERMGIDRAHVGAMERGEKNVTLLTIWLVCQALELKPAQLFEESAGEVGAP
ncbi:MAG: helix-turn-helix domain-containing protein [Allosphingosinicella sp.]|uniref:helix-turn-helix domain-containing protein n=1 Tax=Allosphingosinicella sp. TaxID=2823234 RepID=UPI0039463B48